MTNKNKNPLVLAILDGWGLGPRNKEINAIEAAKTPVFDHLMKTNPHTSLGATGKDVGLESNQMSGSEAGHMNIGAGRIVKQDVRYILEEISNGNFFQNPAFLSTVESVKRFGPNLHLVGMMGTGDSPHSHPDIFLALLVLLKKHNMAENVFFHLFTDGRDSFPDSSLEIWKKWNMGIQRIGIGRLATVCGRFYAMDRAKNWDRLMKAYDLMIKGKGKRYDSIESAVLSNYKKGNTDEYVEPAIIAPKGAHIPKISNNDGIIFFNFRSDRARQFAKFFVGTKTKNENGFPKMRMLKNISFVAMTNFGPDLNLKTAYSSNPQPGTLPSVLGKLRQLYIAETEKFAHVTYFFNGGYADPIDGEERIMIPSPVIRSYAQKPEMSAGEIADLLCKYIKHDVYDFVTVNFANADMVGHTGDFKATVKAIEFVDSQLGKICKAVSNKGGTLIVTADHGNADVMFDPESGRKFVFHTKNPVPFIVCPAKRQSRKIKLKEGGILGNIAPTVLDLLDIGKPEAMNCESLIE